MTAQELIEKYVGKRPRWLMKSLSIPVETVDVRKGYGRIDVKIRPVGGTGEEWVASDTLNYNI